MKREALQMLIFGAGGLQLAFPSAADRWFRQSGAAKAAERRSVGFAIRPHRV